MKILIRNANILDARTDAAAQDILIDGESIAAVGERLPADGAEILDFAGMTVLPAFIDSHVHVVDHNQPREAMLRAFARNGVAAVRDLGVLGTMELEPYLAWLRERKGSEFARVVTAGRYIDVQGGYGMGPDPAMMWGIEVRSPEEAAEKVAYEVACGVDGIKIGLQDGGFGPVAAKMPPSFIQAIVREAARLGVWTAAHIGKVEDLQTVVDCGIGSAAHTPHDAVLPDALIGKMVENGVPMTTTVGDPYAHVAGLPMLPPTVRDRDEYLQRCLAERDTVLENLRRFHEAGGTILAATDLMRLDDPMEQARIPTGELRYLREIGMSTREIIAAGTIRNAEACGIGDLGLVAPGMRACLIAIDGAPDDSFRKLEHPPFVMNRGVILTDAR